MFPLAKYTKLLIIKQAYRNSAKLVYTLEGNYFRLQ